MLPAGVLLFDGVPGALVGGARARLHAAAEEEKEAPVCIVMGACSLREQDQVRTPHLARSCHSRSTKPCHWLWPAPRRTTISHKRDISVCSVTLSSRGRASGAVRAQRTLEDSARVPAASALPRQACCWRRLTPVLNWSRLSLRGCAAQGAPGEARCARHRSRKRPEAAASTDQRDA